MNISKKITEFQEKISPSKLIVVTKKRSKIELEEVLQSGVKDMAESRLQEIQEKYDAALLQKLKDQNVKLHFIGQLQTNKIKKIVELCDVIQSVTSFKHAQKIQNACEEIGKNLEIFIQLNLTDEEQKQGFSMDGDHQELYQLFTEIQKLSALEIKGFMCMGKKDDPQKTREAFKTCKALAKAFNLDEVSMGMSEDYQIAVEEGSTMLRIGSALFEES